MTVPSGSPAWARAAAVGQYGGHPSKRNYGDLEAVDPLTDVTAGQFLRVTADLAALARVAPLCTLWVGDTNTYAPASAQTGNLTVANASTMWGTYPDFYDGASPPTGFPSVVLGATGIGWGYIVTLPASPVDDYSVGQTIEIIAPRITVYSGTAETVEVIKMASNKIGFIRSLSGVPQVGAASLLIQIW